MTGVPMGSSFSVFGQLAIDSEDNYNIKFDWPNKASDIANNAVHKKCTKNGVLYEYDYSTGNFKNYITGEEYRAFETFMISDIELQKIAKKELDEIKKILDNIRKDDF